MVHRRRSIAALVTTALLLHASAVSAAGVHVGMTPALVEVDPAEEFTLDFAITEADAAFNGFDAVVEYDPAMLTFLPAAPASLQQGALMTGVCGNTFHLFSTAADSITFTSALLCAGQSLTGPGALYRLRFRAAAATGETTVRLRSPRVRFYNAGLFVFPVSTADAVVHIGDLTGVAPEATPGIALRALPNPSGPGTTTFRLYAGQSGPQQVSIQDVRGRRMRVFEFADAPAGEHAITWDGLDERGRRLPAGCYQVVFRAGSRQVNGRVVLVH